ncbi:MAG: hypothetical protein AABX89_02670 [Candidatus Thermoplasmatota archaeon]
MRCALAFLALLMLFPPVASAASTSELGIRNPTDSTPTTMFFHVEDALNEFAINTQEPDASFAVTSRVGLATNTLTCFETVPSGFLNTDYHSWFGYSGAGEVLYEPQGIRVSPERGLAFAAELDSAAPWTLHWYLATAVPVEVQGAPPQVLDAAVLPGVAVHAWVREATDIGIGDDGLREGAVLAEGETVGNLGGELATSTTSSTGKITWSSHTDRNGNTFSLYHFELEMEPLAETVSPLGLGIQVSAFLKSDPCTPEMGTVMSNTVALHTSDGNRPRLEWAVRNPLRIEYLHPQIVAGDLVLHSSSNSPWGNYDVAIDNRTTTLTGPDGPVSGLSRADPVQRFNEHRYIDEPLDAAFLFERFVDLPDGRYTLFFQVPNLQGTAFATATAAIVLGDPNELTLCGPTFDNEPLDESGCFIRLQDDEGNSATRSTPGFSVLVLLATVAFAGVVVRRRA